MIPRQKTSFQREGFCSVHILTDCPGGKSVCCVHLLKPPSFLKESCPSLAPHSMHGLIPWVQFIGFSQPDGWLYIAYDWPLLNWPLSSGQSCVLDVRKGKWRLGVGRLLVHCIWTWAEEHKRRNHTKTNSNKINKRKTNKETKTKNKETKIEGATDHGQARVQQDPSWDHIRTCYGTRGTKCLPAEPCVKQGELPRLTPKGGPSPECNWKTEVAHF